MPENMDEDDRESNASSENEQDEVMEDADDADGYNEAEDDENDNENDNDNENENENENDHENDDDQDEGDREGTADDAQESGNKATDDAASDKDGPPNGEQADAAGTSRGSRSPSAQDDERVQPPSSRLFPTVRPEALTAKLYDIVPTMAAPQATSINALAVTPDLRYWVTGGSDGYIRKYDGPGTINGKQLLTVAQRHPFVDSVVKAGILMSYWENEEPSPPNPRGNEEHVTSPVYSLAIHSQALWLLSGLESGGINLQSLRHDEGKRITCLQQHTNAVSVLTLAQDEQSVLSGSWDKNILDWDLNTGNVKRRFEGSGGQISALEVRPVNGTPVPAEASDFQVKSETFTSNNSRAPTNGAFASTNDTYTTAPVNTAAVGAPEAQASPAHESLFGGSDTGSLFGETGAGGFGGGDDDEFSQAMNMTMHDGSGQDGGMEGGMDHSADMATFDSETAPTPAVQFPPSSPLVAKQPPPQPSPVVPPASIPEPATDPMATESTGTQPLVLGEFEAPISAPAEQAPNSPSLVFSSKPAPPPLDPTQSSDTVFFSADINGSIRIWDRRVQDPVARIGTRSGVPPWCMGATWSPDGNWIYAGRRNGTVEEFSIHKARSGWDPERTLKFPAGSGAVTAVRAMPNGRHLICASHDILRLYDTRDTAAFKNSSVPFLIVPGPPRAGVISSLYLDRTCRFMISTAGTRGWEGSSTEVLIGYEINVVGAK
ncbi:hypothetical protein ACHAQH_006677 [Verticillium albo-atrum]